MKKVLMIAPVRKNNYYFGGMGVYAENLEKNKELFKKYDIDFQIFDYLEGFKSSKNRNKIIKRFIMLGNLSRFYSSLKLFLNKNNVEIIHYNSSRKFLLLINLMIIRSVVRKYDISTILHIHFADYDKIMLKSKYINKVMYKIINKYVTKVILLSSLTKNEFLKNKYEENKLAVLHNYHPFDVSIEKIRQKIEQKNKRDFLKMLFIGSIDDRKGIFDILDILENNRNMNIKLTICGTCPSIIFEEKLTSYLSRNENIKFMGYIDGYKKENVFYNNDVLVLPSYGEGLPLVILEAMAFGCCILSTRVGGIPEIVNNNIGDLHRPGDKQHLKSILESYLLNDNDLNLKMLNAFSESIKYNVENYVKDISELYNY